MKRLLALLSISLLALSACDLPSYTFSPADATSAARSSPTISVVPTTSASTSNPVYPYSRVLSPTTTREQAAPGETSQPASSYGLVSREYRWTFEDSEWTWQLDVPQTLYDYYKSLPRAPTTNYSVYVTHPLDDMYIGGLARKIREAAADKGYSEFETIEFAGAFVQSLPYVLDDVSTPYDEYPRYPVETLVDNGGDCEDTSILLASLVRELGYGVVILTFDKTSSSPGHAAVGVAGEDTVSGSYYDYQGTRYYYLETTGTGWAVGEVPDDYKDRVARVQTMKPVPVLTHDWTSKRNSLYAELTVKVSNLGTADANGVYIYAGFDAGNQKMWNPTSSPTFDVAAGYTSTVTMTVRVPVGEHTRFHVQIVYGGFAVDDSYSDWFDT